VSYGNHEGLMGEEAEVCVLRVADFGGVVVDFGLVVGFFGWEMVWPIIPSPLNVSTDPRCRLLLVLTSPPRQSFIDVVRAQAARRSVS